MIIFSTVPFMNYISLYTILLLCVIPTVESQYARVFPGGYDFKAWLPTPTTIRFLVVVPNNQYFAIGFGKTMTNCDMVIWQAASAQSRVQDLYSFDRSTPTID